MLSSQLVSYNDRDTDKIGEYLDEIREALSEDIEGTVNLVFGGSVEKHTYVDGLSDIDALVFVDRSELIDSSPEEVKDYILNCINSKIKSGALLDVKVGDLAVTLTYKDAEIQLLPALRARRSGAFKIADPDGDGWSTIRPARFRKWLTKVNQDNGRKVVPVIKLAKAIIDSQMSGKEKLKGYHLENIAVDLFRKYDGPYTTKEMLKHYFKNAPAEVLKSKPDRSGQSEGVDTYLGADRSSKRKKVAENLARISRRMERADSPPSVTQWEEILGDL